MLQRQGPEGRPMIDKAMIVAPSSLVKVTDVACVGSCDDLVVSIAWSRLH